MCGRAKNRAEGCHKHREPGAAAGGGVGQGARLLEPPRATY